MGQVWTGRELGESTQSTISVRPSLVTSRPGAVRAICPCSWFCSRRLRKIRTHLDTWAPVTSSGFRRLPKSQRKVLQGALISLTLWSAPAFSCKCLQYLINMQISVLPSEEEQTGRPPDLTPNGRNCRTSEAFNNGPAFPISKT